MRIDRPFETLAATARLHNRVGPSALELHDLCAMHQALAGKAHQLRLRLAPSRKGGCPFASTVERIHLMTAVDHAAIDQTRNQRRQFPGGDCKHRLVQQRKPPLHMPLLYKGSALQMPGDRNQVWLTEAATDFGCLPSNGIGGVAISRIQLLLHSWQEKVAFLNAGLLLPLN